MTAILRKYGVQSTINFSLFEVDGIDFRVDAVHASGDSAIMKDEGDEANTSNSFTDEGSGYSLVLTATEMEAARIVIYLVDQTATKIWLDNRVIIETYGNASAQHAFDLGTASVAQTGDNFTRIGAGGVNLTALQGNLGQGIAQGGTAGTIQLASGETFATNELRGCVVNITLGTGKGQSRWISANIGITDTCTIKPDWITDPDDTSIYEIVQGAASMQAILNTVLSETTSGLLANNFDTFYNNNNANTAKIVDDVGTSSPFPTSEWIWSTATSGVPTIGRLRGNNAAVASITELSIHQESDAGKNTGLVISSLRAGDRIQIYFETNPEIFLIFDVTATPVLTGSVYAITGTVDATSGTFTNTGVSVSYEVTGAVQNRVEMDDNSVDLNTIISGVAAIPTTSAPTAVQNRQEMDSNSVDLDSLLSGQTTINNNVLLTALASVCSEARLAELDAANLPAGVDGIQSDLDNATDGLGAIKTAVDAVPTDVQNRQEMDSNSTQLAAIVLDTGTTLPELIDDLAIKKNTVFPNFQFLMVLTSDGRTPATGLTVTGQRSIDAGAFVSVSGAIAEISNGFYQFDALAADTNGDVITWKFSAATADDTSVTFKTVA